MNTLELSQVVENLRAVPLIFCLNISGIVENFIGTSYVHVLFWLLSRQSKKG